MKIQSPLFAICICILQLFGGLLFAQQVKTPMNEPYRPQIHFSPAAHWINDPNGLVYNNGIYHIYFQYHPYSTVWGPMHWGHATSTDLVHWKEQPIALYPDSIGMIFSGSAVIDKNNTSGFGKKGIAPLVAIYAQHNMDGEKAGRNDFQNQSIAYSLDNGKTFVKYKGNPVLKNPGITDFRDPKVCWFEKDKKWVMTLATKDHISFYTSPDLKHWDKQSEFGKNIGAHGGVWECPDLFYFNENGKKVWVLLVNLNPGGPNGGSATQYFLGDFDGKQFTPYMNDTRWLDYGPDEYAGITWSNTGDRKIFLGWMSNWQYANVVPTDKWRNAMTIPRELTLKHVGSNLLLASEPIAELSKIEAQPVSIDNLSLNGNIDLSKNVGLVKFPCRVDLNMNEIKNLSVVLSNGLGEELLIGYDKTLNQYYIDRTRSGKVDFQKDFSGRHVAPRFTDKSNMNITLIIDASSVELFADDGLSVMTETFFPNKPYNKIELRSEKTMTVKRIYYRSLASIWK